MESRTVSKLRVLLWGEIPRALFSGDADLDGVLGLCRMDSAVAIAVALRLIALLAARFIALAEVTGVEYKDSDDCDPGPRPNLSGGM
mmetsp:Transcript_54399/g.129642  ORF Transcript_54399/g.129642 Transcript_54399/m.129642 type:complete len:87 (-) Transcript_54399:1049-1309(-)